MILSFKEQFNEKILNGTKIHTIREDKTGRWHEGMKIHFANHIRTPDYNQFHSGLCSGVQKIRIAPDEGFVLVDGIPVDILEIAKNDGFYNVHDFYGWFDKPFSGRLIHWTDFKY